MSAQLSYDPLYPPPRRLYYTSQALVLDSGATLTGRLNEIAVQTTASMK